MTLGVKTELPSIYLELQSEVERLYRTEQELQQEVIRLSRIPPIVVIPADPPGPVRRRAEAIIPRLRRQRLIAAIRRSGLFDAAWYLQRYPDVGESGIDPAQHFLVHGAADLRDPGPRFSTAAYLARHGDVAGSGLNPLVHYLTIGWSEGRSLAPLSPGTGG